ECEYSDNFGICWPYGGCVLKKAGEATEKLGDDTLTTLQQAGGDTLRALQQAGGDTFATIKRQAVTAFKRSTRLQTARPQPTSRRGVTLASKGSAALTTR